MEFRKRCSMDVASVIMYSIYDWYVVCATACLYSLNFTGDGPCIAGLMKAGETKHAHVREVRYCD